jgi:hypothetical protein
VPVDSNRPQDEKPERDVVDEGHRERGWRRTDSFNRFSHHLSSERAECGSFGVAKRTKRANEGIRMFG